MHTCYLALAVSLMACGNDDIDAPDDCAEGELHVIHGDADEREPLTSLVFVNKISDGPGTLDVGMTGSSRIHFEFDKLVANGDSVAARGYITLTSGFDAGNCETGGHDGRLFVGGESLYRFELSNAHTAPYCSGAAVTESVSGCYQGRRQ